MLLHDGAAEALPVNVLGESNIAAAGRLVVGPSRFNSSQFMAN
jgi:hypothetical protein